jgi:hypothetical protein
MVLIQSFENRFNILFKGSENEVLHRVSFYRDFFEQEDVFCISEDSHSQEYATIENGYEFSLVWCDGVVDNIKLV